MTRYPILAGLSPAIVTALIVVMLHRPSARSNGAEPQGRS